MKNKIRVIFLMLVASVGIIILLFLLRDWWLNITDYYPPGHLVRGLETAIENKYQFELVEDGSFIKIKSLHPNSNLGQMLLAPQTNPDVRNHSGDIIVIEDGTVLDPDQIKSYPKVFFSDPNESSETTAVVIQVDEFRVVEDN